MGARNTRPSLSPLHLELIRVFYMSNEMYEEFNAVSCNFCNELFSTVEYGFGTTWLASLCNLSRRNQESQVKFHTLADHPYLKNT